MGVKVLLILALIAAALAGLWYFNQNQPSPLPPNPLQKLQPLTPATVDSTLDQQSANIDSSLNQMDQDFKELDQTDSSDSDLQGI